MFSLLGRGRNARDEADILFAFREWLKAQKVESASCHFIRKQMALWTTMRLKGHSIFRPA